MDVVGVTYQSIGSVRLDLNFELEDYLDSKDFPFVL